MQLLDERSPAPGCLLLQMDPICANKSPPSCKECLIEHHRRYHWGLNLTFSIPLAKACNAEYLKKVERSLKYFYCQAGQPAVKYPSAEWLLIFLSWLLGYLYSCCKSQAEWSGAVLPVSELPKLGVNKCQQFVFPIFPIYIVFPGMAFWEIEMLFGVIFYFFFFF